MKLAATVILSLLGVVIVASLARYGTLQPCSMLAQEMIWSVATPSTEPMGALGMRMGAEAMATTMSPAACARVLADYAIHGDLWGGVLAPLGEVAVKDLGQIPVSLPVKQGP
jgi:hypothetical protein